MIAGVMAVAVDNRMISTYCNIEDFDRCRTIPRHGAAKKVRMFMSMAWEEARSDSVVEHGCVFMEKDRCIGIIKRDRVLCPHEGFEVLEWELDSRSNGGMLPRAEKSSALWTPVQGTGLSGGTLADTMRYDHPAGMLSSWNVPFRDRIHERIDGFPDFVAWHVPVVMSNRYG
jgi:hypothetical protein